MHRPDTPFRYRERIAKIDRVQTRVNDQIRISPVRVVSPAGDQLGILPTTEAIEKAKELSLDLVEVAPNERPPVCRIMDYGKYRYEQSQKKKKSHSYQTKTKEIRLRPKTGEHDIDFKIKKAIGFLKQRDKVLVSVIFRGRENAHEEEGRKVMQGVVDQLLEEGKLESPPSKQGRRLICTISPR